jgi:hypothetical protein
MGYVSDLISGSLARGGMPGGPAAVAEVAEAVAEFGGQLGLVEVADELRVPAGVGSLQTALG